MRSWFAFVCLICVVSLTVPVFASVEEEAKPEPAAASSADGGDGYSSPDREKCEEELRKDDAWRASLKGQLRLKVHEEESHLVTRNNKHVVMAYAALWLIVVFFVVQLWRKQRSLREEIERLQQEVKDAAAE